jgi:hypothetical protein
MTSSSTDPDTSSAAPHQPMPTALHLSPSITTPRFPLASHQPVNRDFELETLTSNGSSSKFTPRHIADIANASRVPFIQIRGLSFVSWVSWAFTADWDGTDSTYRTLGQYRSVLTGMYAWASCHLQPPRSSFPHMT